MLVATHNVFITLNLTTIKFVNTMYCILFSKKLIMSGSKGWTTSKTNNYVINKMNLKSQMNKLNK